ncbi:ion-translocating oxidoreductase complex subunit C-like [Lolium rigidum]|uniref:ion-translocating oxidoreductase complex subunit C-like n=1 Tax=Lolium rigidum TaxID=89674 RepID=UPI001F5D92EC|nr:ion-translocating oxidoreductase complex subunit C-like [Lolium rigidum]
MVAGFRRTISFPAPRSSSSPAAAAGPNGKSAEGYRVRSASLPCRFHPLVLQLDEDVSALRDLAAGLASAPTARAIGAAAEQLGRVLASLSGLLHHPLAQDPLHRLARSPLAERLLDDFLRLADAHGSFRASLVALAALQAEARAALRREDAARLASAARGLRRSGRDLPRIASAARAVAAKAPPPAPAGLPSDAAALAAAVVDAAAAVASASAAVFSGVSALSVAAAAARVDVVGAPPCWMPSPARFASSTPRTNHHVIVTTRTSSSMRVWWVADLMRWMSRAKRRSATKQHNDAVSSNQQPRRDATVADVDPEEEDRKAAFDRMDNLGRCIADVEGSGEQVFRALVNTRVSLLNILSPTI